MNLICFSHLRWNFVYQRPQHLFSRFAKYYTVYYIEEPLFNDEADHCTITLVNENIYVVTPNLDRNSVEPDVFLRQNNLLKKLFYEQNINDYIFWYYSPMAFLFGRSFHPSLIVYDCMDELSAFKFAPPQIKEVEKELLKNADVVFTGGHSLFQAKKDLHPNIFAFPSSIDKKHFSKARLHNQQPPDQANISQPRLGFFGVLDERFDIDLIRQAAEKKPGWSFIFLGPVVKINFNDLPHYNNIYYLGNKSYNELPAYISSWDIALIPFAINESTQFISPTKTPEYLAAGKPVISTAIKDVVKPYGENNLVSIIHSADEFITAAEQILQQKNKQKWLKHVDEFLADNSWDNTFDKMNAIIKKTFNAKKNYLTLKNKTYV